MTTLAPAKVVVFHCDGGSLAGGAEALEAPGAGFVRVNCVGRVSLGLVLRALRRGAQGVLLAARDRLGEKQIGDVGAHDEHQEAAGSQQRDQDLAIVLEQDLADTDREECHVGAAGHLRQPL